jgi:anti-anti-sigma regulatory factor
MPQASYPIVMIADIPVVTVPPEITSGNADQLRIALLEAAVRGTGTLVLDMTSTWRCDASGCRVLERAHRRAVASHGELRLVIASARRGQRGLARPRIGRSRPGHTQTSPGHNHALASVT